MIPCDIEGGKRGGNEENVEGSGGEEGRKGGRKIKLTGGKTSGKEKGKERAGGGG